MTKDKDQSAGYSEVLPLADPCWRIAGYSVLGENTGPILQPLVGLMAGREGGRPAHKICVDFKIFYRLNY